MVNFLRSLTQNLYRALKAALHRRQIKRLQLWHGLQG